MWIKEVCGALGKAKVAFAIAGGYAVALHGAVRGTIDLDIVLRLEKAQYLSAEAALKAMGLQPRLPVTAAEVFEFREEYIKNRNLVAWSFVNPRDPSQIVDIVLTRDLAKMRTKKIDGLPVLAKADLVAMKKESGRPQDLADIEALESLEA